MQLVLYEHHCAQGEALCLQSDTFCHTHTLPQRIPDIKQPETTQLQMVCHPFSPYAAGQYRELDCAKYLQNLQQGREQDSDSGAAAQFHDEKAEEVAKMKDMLNKKHAFVDTRFTLARGTVRSVVTEMATAAASHPICFFDSVTIVPSPQDFPNVAQFDPNLLSVKVVDNEVVLCLYVFTNSAEIRNRHGIMLTLSALVLEDLLRTDAVHDVAVHDASIQICPTVGTQRISLNWHDCEQSTANPSSWEHVKRGMFEHRCKTFAKSIHERYPKEVRDWTLNGKCRGCVFRSTCEKDAEGTLKLLPVRDFVHLVEIDPEDGDGLVKLQTLWKRRREDALRNVQQIAARLGTDHTDDAPAMLASAMQNKPVLRTPAVLNIQREEPEVELVVSFLYFEDRTATLFSGCCVVIDRINASKEHDVRDLGMTVHEVREALEKILNECQGKTMQIYTVTDQERMELENFVSFVRENDPDGKYPNVKSISEGFPIDVFGGTDAFNAKNLALRGKDYNNMPAHLSISASRRVVEWLALAKSMHVPYNGDVDRYRKTADAVMAIATDMGNKLGLHSTQPEDVIKDVIKYCTTQSGEMARTTAAIVDLENLLSDAYFSPQTAHIDYKSWFAYFGCAIEPRDAYFLEKDARTKLHQRTAIAGAKLLSGKWLRGAVGDGCGTPGTIVALGQARRFPYVQLCHTEHVVCGMRCFFTPALHDSHLCLMIPVHLTDDGSRWRAHHKMDV